MGSIAYTRPNGIHPTYPTSIAKSGHIAPSKGKGEEIMHVTRLLLFAFLFYQGFGVSFCHNHGDSWMKKLVHTANHILKFCDSTSSENKLREEISTNYGANINGRLRSLLSPAVPFLHCRRLTPTEQLATTPLFYIGGSRGNSYLQDDLQVIALCE
jgi:hypothetical protein